MRRTLLILSSLIGILVILAVSGIFSRAPISPSALTRYSIEQAELVADSILIADQSNEDLNVSLASAVTNTDAFKGGYLKFDNGQKRLLLDGWGHPMIVMAKAGLLSVKNASPDLLR